MAFRLKDVRWQRKLLACFLLLSMVGFLPVALTILGLRGMNEALDVTQAENREMQRYNEVAQGLLHQEMLRRDYLLTGNDALLRQEAVLGRRVAELVESTAGAVEDEEEVDELRRLLPLMAAGHERFVSLAAARKAGSAGPVSAGYFDDSNKNLDVLEGLLADSRAEIREAEDQKRAEARRGMLVSLILAGVSVLVGLALSVGLARSITRPIAHLREVADRVSMSDLGATIDIDREDEIGELAAAFQRMVVAVRYFAAEAQVGTADEEPAKTRSSA